MRNCGNRSSGGHAQVPLHHEGESRLGRVGAEATQPTRGPAKKGSQSDLSFWSRFTITCQDSRISLVFNGEQVINIDLIDWREPRKNPDGTSNKSAVALKDFARKGPIGLQGLHGDQDAELMRRTTPGVHIPLGIEGGRSPTGNRRWWAALLMSLSFVRSGKASAASQQAR